MLITLAVANYRSLRDLVMPLGPLTVVTGPNGSGKSSVYRALRLLAATADGGIVAALAREGGLSSTLWAGPETIGRAVRRGEQRLEGTVRQTPVNLKLGFAAETFGYSIEIGLPSPPSSGPFGGDPEIKRECIWAGPSLRPSSLQADRRGPMARVRDEDNAWQIADSHVAGFDSILSRIADPQRAAEVLLLRERLRNWRFYDHFRTDPDAPARRGAIGTRTPVLANDGSDLGAALETIREIGDAAALDEAIEDAFPGSRLRVRSEDGRFSVQLQQHGLLRPLDAAELSDGTLRYLLLVAALLTPRPPELMVLNEPETSLHPDLLPALARLIGKAARNGQLWIVSHATRLIAALEQNPDCHSLHLEKDFGATTIAGQQELDKPSWHWPERRGNHSESAQRRFSAPSASDA